MCVSKERAGDEFDGDDDDCNDDDDDVLERTKKICTDDVAAAVADAVRKDVVDKRRECYE